MTSFDFVMTIAMGSMVASASQSQEWPKFLQTIAAMAALFVMQFVAAKLRRASDTAGRIIQNEPIVLMRDGIVLDGALEKTRVSRDDLFAKLREANVLSLDEVRVVVLETTGDVSVMHGERMEQALLRGVRSSGDAHPPGAA